MPKKKHTPPQKKTPHVLWGFVKAMQDWRSQTPADCYWPQSAKMHAPGPQQDAPPAPSSSRTTFKDQNSPVFVSAKKNIDLMAISKFDFS